MRKFILSAFAALGCVTNVEAHTLAVPFPNFGTLSDAHRAAFAIFQTTSTPVAATPATANIPVASLTSGSYPANNWSGFTTNITTVSTNTGRQYIQTTTAPTTNTTAIGTGNWRDGELTFYISRGTVILRGNSGGDGIYLRFAIGSSGIRAGLMSNINYNLPEGGTVNATYIQDNPASCITNWPTTSDHTFTFGARGFDIYLLIDGVQAYDTCQTTAMNPTGEIRWKDYRTQATNPGQMSIWAHGGSLGGGVGNQITATYYPLTELYSNIATSTFDPRDFGMRDVPVGSGSMTAGSCTLTLSSPRDIRVNDKIIVEIGGESGAGGYNTVGVGGTSPELNYPNAATRSADLTQPNMTYAYDADTGAVAQMKSGTWQTTFGGPAPNITAAAIYYAEYKAPVSLRAGVIAVDASPATTLTLATFGSDSYPGTTCARVNTTNANVYLDSRYSFYPMSTNPAEMFFDGRSDGINSYSGMTINIPAGTWYMGGIATAYRVNAGDRANLTIKGQGKLGAASVTTLKSPKGVPSLIFSGSSGMNNTVIQDLHYIGNRADNGYMWEWSTTFVDGAGKINKNFPEDNPIAMVIGGQANNALIQRISCHNTFRGCAVVQSNNGAQIANSDVVNTERQRNYLQWEFMLVNSTGGSNKLENLTATSPYLYKAFNCYATNPCLMNNLTGTNVLLAVNGSSSTTVTGFQSTIEEDSFADIGSGWLDEGVVQISNNNSAGGSGGTISGFRIIHNGYTQVSSQRSLKSIDITATQQVNWNITGSYSGVGTCSSLLGGYIEYINAPFSSLSGSSYGAMGVVSAANTTVVTGIRVVGSAITSPGLSGHYGNISVSNTGNSASGNVADQIQATTLGAGNRTNATFCP